MGEFKQDVGRLVVAWPKQIERSSYGQLDGRSISEVGLYCENLKY